MRTKTKIEIRKILGEMMTYKPFDKVMMPAELFEKKIVPKLFRLIKKSAKK